MQLSQLIENTKTKSLMLVLRSARNRVAADWGAHWISLIRAILSPFILI